VAIQNTTFGGIRGFTVRPSTPFSDTDGQFAGLIHQERNVTYALFYGAGHMVPMYQPKAVSALYFQIDYYIRYSYAHRGHPQAYAFVRDFVLGNNQTGLVTTSGGTTSVVGGVHTEYQNGILTASEVYTGALTTAGTYTWPSENWAAWESYMATRTAADVAVVTAPGDGVIIPGATTGVRSGTARIQQWTMARGALCGLAIALLALL